MGQDCRFQRYLVNVRNLKQTLWSSFKRLEASFFCFCLNFLAFSQYSEWSELRPVSQWFLFADCQCLCSHEKDCCWLWMTHFDNMWGSRFESQWRWLPHRLSKYWSVRVNNIPCHITSSAQHIQLLFGVIVIRVNQVTTFFFGCLLFDKYQQVYIYIFFILNINNKKWQHLCLVDTYSPILAQIASAALSRTSDPSNRIQSHTLRTVSSGRHVANRVRNHCIVNTLIRGGSYTVPVPFCTWACAWAWRSSRCLDSQGSFTLMRSLNTAMSTDKARRLLEK